MAEQEILNVRLGEGDRSVVLLDQSQLPNRVEYRTVTQLPDMVEAIQSLRVRGAPAIGIFAGYCLYVLARQLMEQGLSGSAFLDELDRQGKVLVSSRPTAVNLAWAVGRLTNLAARMAGAPVEEIVSALGAEARAIRREDEEMCQKIAEHGLSLLKPGDGVLTHCNAGPLATSKYGTALGPILLGHERGIPPERVCRRDPAPPPGGPAHRLGAPAGGGGCDPHLRQHGLHGDEKRLCSGLLCGL